MRWSWLALILAGCPFVWGPPELADTDGVGSDTDPGPTNPATGNPATGNTPTGDSTTVEPPTGTGTPTGTPTGTTATGAPTGTGATTPTTGATDTGTPPGTGTPTGPTSPEPPEVSSLSAEVRYGEVAVIFTLADPDGDLPGGQVTLDVDGTPTVYAIPGDLDAWSAGTGTIVLAEPADCAGFARTYTLTPEDAAGNVGAAEVVDVDVPGFTVVELAVGAHPLGAVPLPVIVCGALKNNSDADLTSFLPTVGGAWTVTLAYTVGAADFDVELSDALLSPIASATSAANPDSVQANFVAGALHHFEVAVNAGGGAGGDWTLMVHE